MNKQKWTELLIFIVAAELVGVLSGIVAGNTNSFYQELAKHGIAVEVGIVERNGALGKMQSLYVRDPDNNLVEISRYE